MQWLFDPVVVRRVIEPQSGQDTSRDACSNLVRCACCAGPQNPCSVRTGVGRVVVGGAEGVPGRVVPDGRG